MLNVCVSCGTISKPIGIIFTSDLPTEIYIHGIESYKRKYEIESGSSALWACLWRQARSVSGKS